MAQAPKALNAACALSRFGLGPRYDLTPARRGEIEQDPRAFLKAGLGVDAALLRGADLTDTKTNLVAVFEQQQQKKMERQMAGAETAAMAPMAPSAATPKPVPVQRNMLLIEAQARFAKAFQDETGLVERLVWFWSNHFAVSMAKGNLAVATAGSFEREAIRPHVLGKFSDMLRSVEQHPTMLYFLDNRNSIGPNSKAGQRRNKGLNENLAREIMELHTLGVGGGYTQADVSNLARIITGWTFAGLNNATAEPGVFAFNANTHEPGAQKFLGRDYSQDGVAQGEAALDDLAHHPATAKHIAFKFAKHFVADQPPASLLDKLAKNFTATGGDLKALTFTLLDDDSAWSTPAAKLRSPQEYLMASSRALNLPPEKPQVLMRALNELGQPLWKPSGPNGFGDDTTTWASPEGLKVRLSYAIMMASQAQVTGNILGDTVSTETRQAIARAESKQQGLALLLMSPEFQRR